MRSKHSNDAETRVRHHNFPSCEAVSCCRNCCLPLPTVKGRKIHEKRAHGGQIEAQQGGSSPSSEENEEANGDFRASQESQENISFSLISANNAQSQQPIIMAQVVQTVGSDPAVENQDMQLVLDEGITVNTLLTTFNQGLFTLHHRWISPMRVISTNLIQLIMNNDDNSEYARVAFFILPGLLKAISIIKSPKPIDFLNSCISPTFLSHLSKYIIQQAAYVHRKVIALRERNGRRRTHTRSTHCRKAEHIIITRHRRRIERLFRDGRCAAATNVVEQAHQALSSPLAVQPSLPPTLDQTQHILLGLNPIATEDDYIPPPEPGGIIIDSFDFEPAFIQCCIRDLPKGSANGASGWSYNVIHQLYANPNEEAAHHLSILSLFLSSLANGKLSNHLWTTSRAVLIPKPEAGKFRPIGIGEAWYRLLGRCILKDVGAEVGQQLKPIQMGCGVSGGSEIAARMAQVFLDAHPCHILIKTDFKNAFNLTPRRLMLEGLERYCPRLVPWFRWAYGGSSPLVDSLGRTVGSSQRGCRQGDPLAALLFCVAIQGSLVEVKELLQHVCDEATSGSRPIPMHMLQHPGAVIAYMDDCTIAVPACLANHVAGELSSIFEATGLILNKQKCRFIGPEAANIADPEFACDPEGDIILGSPTGTNGYRALQCQSLVDKMEVALPTLVRLQLDPMIATNLIRYCINTKACYLARVQEPQQSRMALEKMDMSVDLALCRIAEHIPRNPQQPVAEDQSDTIGVISILRSIPLHHGGLGIQRHSWVSGQVACIKSRNITRAFAEEFFSDTAGFGEAIDRWPAMSIGDNPEDPDVPGVDPQNGELRNLAEAAFIAKAASLHNNLLTLGMKSHAAWFLSSQFEGSGRWISPPVGIQRLPHLTIRREEYRQALRARLLLHPLEEQLRSQPNQVQHCHCLREPYQHRQQNGVLSVAEPFHCLDCVRAKGLLKGRHDAVMEVLDKFIKKRFPGTSITREPVIQTRPEVQEQLRADLMVCLPQPSGRHFIIDVTVSNPAAPTYRAQAIRSHEVVQATNSRRDLDKTARYHGLSSPDITLVAPRRYFTFNVEATGRLGASACLFVEELYLASGRHWELAN